MNRVTGSPCGGTWCGTVCGFVSLVAVSKVWKEWTRFFFFKIVRADLSTDRLNLYDCFNLIRLMWLIMIVRWIK